MCVEVNVYSCIRCNIYIYIYIYIYNVRACLPLYCGHMPIVSAPNLNVVGAHGRSGGAGGHDALMQDLGRPRAPVHLSAPVIGHHDCSYAGLHCLSRVLRVHDTFDHHLANGARGGVVCVFVCRGGGVTKENEGKHV